MRSPATAATVNGAIGVNGRDYVNERLGHPAWSPKRANGSANGSAASASRIVATYDYCDEAGRLVYQVLRKAPKDFRQRRPDLDKRFGVAIATPNGTTLGGVSVKHGDVLYLACEGNKRRMQRRLRKMLPLGNRPERLHLVYGWRSLDEGGLEDLRAWIEHVATDPKLIVIDVLEMVRPRQGRSEGIYSYDYRCLSPLKALAERYGVANVVIHHTNKGTYADPFDCVSGSKGLTGAADSTLVLTRDAQGYVLYGRGRDIEEFETAMVFDRTYGTWTATGAAEEARRSSERNIILDALLKAGGSLSPAEISAATRMKGENVRFLLFKMLAAEEVLKSSRGRYRHPDQPDPANNANNRDGATHAQC
jgi:AAA domain